MKSFSKQEINTIIEDSEVLKNEIIESKGFILYLADKYNIEIPIDSLMDSISKYSIRYITEDTKKRKYSPEQMSVVIEYLKEEKDDYSDNYEKVESYSLGELLKDIKDTEVIPKNASDLLKISFNEFLDNQKELSKLLDISNDDYWRDQFNTSHSLLSPIFKKIKKEDFLKIDLETLGSHPGIFSMAKHLMNDEEIKSLFNQAVNFYYQIPEVKKGGYRPKLENYRNYPFNQNEKELFVSLLRNEYTSDYERVRSYQGFNHFFTKNEYILNNSVSSIQYLSKKEIADNLPKIREGVVSAYFKSHYQNVEKIYSLRIDEESFKAIFTPEFVKELIQKSDGFYFHYFDRDNQKKTTAMNITHKMVYKLCSEDKEILKLVGFQNILNDAVNLIEHNRNYFDSEYADPIKEIIGGVSQEITSDKIFKNTDGDKIKAYSKYDVPKLIIENMQGKESINYLYVLMQVTNKENNRWENKPYVEEINRVIPLLNKDDVILLSKTLNYKIDKKLLKDNPRQGYENNLLNFNPEIIKNMSMSNFKSTFLLSKEFRDMVLDSNLDNIIIEDRNKNKNERYSRDLILHLLNNIEDKKSPYFDFVKKFIKKNREFMVENYFSNLVTHPMRESLIKIDTKDLEKDSYSKIEKVLSELADASLKYDELYALREEVPKKDRKKIDDERDIVSNKKDELTKEVDSVIKNISFEFYQQKIKEADPIKAIQLYNINRGDHQDTIYNKIENLDFNTTKELLNNKVFLQFIFNNKQSDSSNNNEKRVLVLNKNFNDIQNVELVELMLKNFNDKSLFIKQYEKEVCLNKVLYLIHKDNRGSITNDLVVKHDPANMFNSYDYLPKETGYFQKHVTHEFSNQQIIDAIENLNKMGKKIICITNQNLSHDNLLSHNFSYESNNKKNKNEANPKLNEYLDLLKYLEKDPINYLACIHSDIIQNFIERDKFEYLDIAKSDFYNKHVNIDVVVEGIKEIFKISSEFYASEDKYHNDDKTFKGIAVKNALKAVTNFISFTYYSDSRNDVLISEFTEDKSKKILKIVMEEAPYLYFSLPYVGKLGSTTEELANNFREYYYDGLIDNFFLNSSKLEIVSEHLSLEYDKKQEYWQSTSADKFITGLIEYLTLERKADELYSLDCIIKEKKFNEEQRPYGKKLREYETILTEFMNHLEYEKLIEKSLLFIDLLQSTEKKEVKIKSRNKI